MRKVLQIIKVNEPRAWSIEGNSGVSHSAECILLNEDGSVEQVGVLKMRGEEIIKKGVVGTFAATFEMRANPGNRVIEAQLVDLVPICLSSLPRGSFGLHVRR